MPRISQENKILEAALHCFAKLGYEGTRTRQIAERAGVAESALYRHYASKEAIAHTLFEDNLKELIANLQKIAASSLSTEVKLKGFIKLGLDNYRSNPAAISYILLQPPNFEHTLPEGFVSPLDIVAEIITQGQKEGSVRTGPPTLLAAAFLGCFMQTFAFAILPIFKTINADLILENEQTLIDLAWAAIAHPD